MATGYKCKKKKTKSLGPDALANVGGKSYIRTKITSE